MKAALRSRYLSCTRCSRRASCPAPLPPSGSLSPALVVVGSAPSARDQQSGRLLSGTDLFPMIAKQLGFKRGECLTVASVACHGPSKPTTTEIDACRTNLRMTLRLSNPAPVLLVGQEALTTFRPGDKIGRAHGYPFWRKGRVFFPIEHPASIIYDPKVKTSISLDLDQLAGLLLAPDGLAVFWPDKCVTCRLDVHAYDAEGLPYCQQHWSDGSPTLENVAQL